MVDANNNQTIKVMNSESPFPNQSKVAAYLRDSGHEDQDLSVAQQEIAIRAWCEQHGLVLTKVFIDEAAPGSTVVGREAFRRLITHFHQPGCREAGVILWKYNRFARDIDDAQFYKADLRRRGYIIHSLNDSVPSGLDGRFFESAIDWMNARYLEDLSTDVKRGLHHIMDQHGAIGGTPPRGFRREAVEIGSRRDGRAHIVHRWAPDPDLVDKVRLAFEMRAAGASCAQIQDATRLYKNKNCWPTFFRNKIYMGVMEFGGRVIEDYCEPIVDRATWEAVQARGQEAWRKNMKNRKNHPRRLGSRFLLSGLAVCRLCGSALSGDTATAKGHRYDYYTCSGANLRDDCVAGKIPKLLLEDAVLDNLLGYILEPDHIRELAVELETDAQQAANRYELKKADTNRSLAILRRKINNLVEVIADQGMAARALVDQVKELEAEETRLRLELEDLTPGRIKLRDQMDLDELVNEIRSLRAGNETARLREVLGGLIDRVEAARDGEKISGTIWYYSPVLDKR
ncbi:hypothetical protein SY88_23880, partial [Clostridiales bacterium PH28_bin88]